MSSFYKRESEPMIGDIGTHEIYGTVSLVGQIAVSSGTWEDFWLVEVENEELKIVRLDQLTNIGYYGD